LLTTDTQRIEFLKSCLSKLGLRVNKSQVPVPSLSRMHLSSLQPSDIQELLETWQEIITKEENGDEFVKGDNDTFHLERRPSSAWSLGTLAKALPGVKRVVGGDEKEETTDSETDNLDRLPDYNAIVKNVRIHDQSLPGTKETPCFNHHAFFANLQYFQENSKAQVGLFGRFLLYGEVVTSTNTMLEK
jgi:biotin---protein ligase